MCHLIAHCGHCVKWQQLEPEGDCKSQRNVPQKVCAEGQPCFEDVETAVPAVWTPEQLQGRPQR